MKILFVLSLGLGLSGMAGVIIFPRRGKTRLTNISGIVMMVGLITAIIVIVFK